ncbi:MAG: hypothetical protein HDT34_02360 [Clostridiales bacterium]|nr:hypothetical protein [Clostridiales bacterium]
MTEYKNVQSTIKPKEIEIDEYSVWVNSDIKEITVTDENGIHTEYEFNQKQYTKDEYIQLIDENNKQLEDKLTDTQLALCDVYEMIGG